MYAKTFCKIAKYQLYYSHIKYIATLRKMSKNEYAVQL